jgi:hypothetical protein
MSKNVLNSICEKYVSYSVDQFDLVYTNLRKLCGSCKHLLSQVTGPKKLKWLGPYGEEPSGSKNAGISWLAAEPGSFSRGTLLHGVSK